MVTERHKELHKEHVLEAKEILKYNRKKLYKLREMTRKYEALRTALNPLILQDLLDIITYWLKRDCIGFRSYGMVYFLSTHNGTYAVRRKTTSGVTNRRLNYLCALGLLRKLEQIILEDGYDQKPRRFMRKNLITIVNRNVLKYDRNTEKRPINTFEVFKYTTEVLEECNRRAERLLEAKITPGNISYNQLAINGLGDIAYDVYLEARPLSAEKKLIEYEILTECIDFLISEKGYTTKEELFTNCLLDDNEIEKLFKIFKQQFLEKYTYRQPSKDDKELFGITSSKWIIKSKMVKI